jgi:hypothetical protein
MIPLTVVKATLNCPRCQATVEVLTDGFRVVVDAGGLVPSAVTKIPGALTFQCPTFTGDDIAWGCDETITVPLSGWQIPTDEDVHLLAKWSTPVEVAGR